MTIKPFEYQGRPVIFDDVAGSEHHVQARFIVMCRDHELEYPDLRFLYAVPNGGKRSYRTAVVLKDEGVKRGVLDVHLPVPHGGYFGWWCEFKYLRRVPSDEQEDMIAFLRLKGHYVIVSWSADEALKDLIAYLDLEPTPGKRQHSRDCTDRGCVPTCPYALAQARAAAWPQPLPRLF